jgi:hypothetical protein
MAIPGNTGNIGERNRSFYLEAIKEGQIGTPPKRGTRASK